MNNNVTRRRFIQLGTGIMTGLMIPGRVRGFLGKEKASVTVDVKQIIGEISPDIYGQFIEHLGRAIYGGIFEAGSPLSDANGFRKDVLEKVRQLQTPLMRYPGGTVTKIYHWKDGIGPVDKRPVRRNLIWGGEDSNHFGTDEFMKYSAGIGAAPFLTVNMNTGTPEEASDWVEYCNANGNSYFAALRKANGHAAPYDVKYWGLGNEEAAKEDAGILQKPEDYIERAWYFAKLMKLQDPNIKLVMVGDNDDWNRKVLASMHTITDYISLHLYANSKPGNPNTLFSSIAAMEEKIVSTAKLIRSIAPDKVENFARWYRFPSRQQPVKIALDEWGIWESGGTGDYALELNYNWNHALGVATFFNIFQRHADSIGMATWAQTVNVLAPLMTNKNAVVAQTIFYPMMLYRQLSGNKSVSVALESPHLYVDDLPALDVSASLDDKTRMLTIAIVNRDAKQSLETVINLPGVKISGAWKAHTLNAPAIEAMNTLADPDKNVVEYLVKSWDGKNYVAPPHSITFLQGKIAD